MLVMGAGGVGAGDVCGREGAQHPGGWLGFTGLGGVVCEVVWEALPIGSREMSDAAMPGENAAARRTCDWCRDGAALFSCPECARQHCAGTELRRSRWSDA